MRIQLARRRIDAIAFLGYGQRNNGHLRFAKFLNNGRQRIEFGIQAFMHSADNNRLISVSAFFQHGKQVILFAKLTHQHIATEQANLTDTPVAPFGV
ncbi:hypothetical protein D3C87_1351150 [compost metagenome]